jgi:hypothetical protein
MGLRKLIGVPGLATTFAGAGSCGAYDGKTGLGSPPYNSDLNLNESIEGEILRTRVPVVAKGWNVNPEVAVAKIRQQQLDSFILQETSVLMTADVINENMVLKEANKKAKVECLSVRFGVLAAWLCIVIFFG